MLELQTKPPTLDALHFRNRFTSTLPADPSPAVYALISNL